MMRFGMPSLIETKTLEDCAALCAQLGLDFVELNMNLPQYQIQTMDAVSMKEVARKYGISYTIHLDENMNVADFNPLVADAYRETVYRTIGLAKELEIPVLNMHMPLGVYFTLPQGKVFLFGEYRQRFYEEITSFRDECERTIGGSGIKICIENWFGYTPWQIEALDILLESPVFGLTFDVGHNHCKGGVDEPVILERDTHLHHMHLHDVLGSKDHRALGTGELESPVFGLTFDVGHNHCKGGVDEPVILERSDHLHHMHLHDVVGSKDHRALGTGELDVPKYLQLARERDCSVVLETKTVEGLTESVRWLREYEKRGSA